MTDAPNPDDFSKIEFPGEFEVELEVKLTITETVAAKDHHEAEQIAEDLIWNSGVNVCGDELYDVEVTGPTRPKRPMYRVLRDGVKYQASHLYPGDLPREPDEQGF